jgi:Uncharacterized conserved protein (COG2071)
VLPMLAGTIKRRLLINFRADPQVAQSLIPAPLRVLEHKGSAIVGICLIRLEHIRPKGLPQAVGISSENMAHRIAVKYNDETNTEKEAVYIWRRHSNNPFNTLAGGRLFPGVHTPATFSIREDGETTELQASTADHKEDVHVKGSDDISDEEFSSKAFDSFEEARDFFARGSCGFSCGPDGKALEGMQLITNQWLASPLKMSLADSAFYTDQSKWPRGSVELDCGLIMRNIEHEWKEMDTVPTQT